MVEWRIGWSYVLKVKASTDGHAEPVFDRSNSIVDDEPLESLATTQMVIFLSHLLAFSHYLIFLSSRRRHHPLPWAHHVLQTPRCCWWRWLVCLHSCDRVFALLTASRRTLHWDAWKSEECCRRCHCWAHTNRGLLYLCRVHIFWHKCLTFLFYWIPQLQADYDQGLYATAALPARTQHLLSRLDHNIKPAGVRNLLFTYCSAMDFIFAHPGHPFLWCLLRQFAATRLASNDQSQRTWDIVCSGISCSRRGITVGEYCFPF